MISLNPDEIASQYGSLALEHGVNYNYFDEIQDYYFDKKFETRGRWWRIGMYFMMALTTDTPAGAAAVFDDGIMNCGVCFDVKKEDAELKSGHKGIGACYYQQDGDLYVDSNTFGSVEAQGSDSFRFAPDEENDWDIDGSGWNDDYSWGYPENHGAWPAYFDFVSEPLDLNANSGKNLGIRKTQTFLKCYVGQADAIDSSDIFDTDISLANFSTDKPRRMDLSCIEDAASRLFAGVSLLIALIA